MKTFMTIVILILPTLFEVYRDKYGDVHPNYDWRIRGITCFIVACIISFLMYDTNYILNLIRFTTAATFLFAALFPYWINYIHLKNNVTTYAGIPKSHRYGFRYLTMPEILNHVVKHLSDRAWPDKEKWWRSFGWGGRAIVYLVFLFVGVWLIVL